MTEICPVCGLPKELCVCETISKEQQKITIKKVTRRYGKAMTIISGLDPKNIDVKELTKYLKTKLACGGTYKDGVIELQGDQREKAKKALIEKGFKESSISLS